MHGPSAPALKLPAPPVFERRKSPRILLSLPVVSQSTGTSAKIVDLSEGGLRLVSKLPFPNNDPETLCVKLPHEVINASVRPVWSAQDGSGGRYTSGMAFAGFTAEDTQKLRQALLRYQTRGLLRRAKDASKKALADEFILKQVFAFVTKLASLQAGRGFDETYSLTVQEEISKTSDELIREANRVEERLEDKLSARQLKAHLRRLVGHWTFQSEVMRRGFEKPKGYPGDYFLLELIYANRLVSGTPIGAYFDGYFLNNPYAIAVRNRKDAMTRILWRVFSTAERPLHLLNIACGGCREIRDACLDPALVPKVPITFSCFDQDKEALDFSREALATLPPNVRSKVKFRFLEGDVLNFSKDPEHFRDLFGQPDIIYSIGLADYLPDRVLRNVVRFCYEILHASGKLIVAFKDKGQDEFAPLPPDWFCDWRFIPRTSEDIRAIVADSKLTHSSLTLEWEWSRKIVFATIQKG